ATNHFTVAVNEVNVAPVLPIIGTQSVNAFAGLTVTNAATDSNIHAILSYSLVNAPAGININANGVITWTPEAAGTNVITTIATATDGYDLVNPTLTATNSFTVIVRPVTEISGVAWLGNGQFQFSFNTVAGQNYTIEYSTNLVQWTPLLELQGDGSPFNIVDPNANNAQGFYRIASP
ncbi:MAG: putative Ig domain-containing protein, partial [Verrucomicrobiota bacterium]